MRQNFRFQRFFVWHFVHHWGVFLGFTAQRHKLLSIYRCTKSQAGFNVYAVKHIGFICMARLTRLARITRLTGFTGFARSTRNPRLTSPRQPHLFAKNDDALLPTLPGTCQPLCCCLRGVFFCSACSIMFSCPLHTQAHVLSNAKFACHCLERACLLISENVRPRRYAYLRRLYFVAAFVFKSVSVSTSPLISTLKSISLRSCPLG